MPVHDAWFDADDVRYEPDEQTVVVPFAQEAFQWENELPPSGVPQREFVRESRWYAEYRVPFLASYLVIRNAVSIDAPSGWGEMGNLFGVRFDAETSEVVVESNETMGVGVTELAVEARITRDVARFIRRRVFKVLGAEHDTPWE